MFDIEQIEESDFDELKGLIQEHFDNTQSPKAKGILDQWETEYTKFVKVIPREYRKVLAKLQSEGKGV